MSGENEMNGKERHNRGKKSAVEKKKSILGITNVKHKFVKQQKGEFSAYTHSTYCCHFFFSKENVIAHIFGVRRREEEEEKKGSGVPIKQEGKFP